MENKFSYAPLALSPLPTPTGRMLSNRARGVPARGKAPLCISGKADGESWGHGCWRPGLQPQPGPSGTSAGLPSTWLGKWEEGMKKTAADHRPAPCALALK